MLIIWDFDGTLVNSLPSTLEAMRDGIESITGGRPSNQEIMAHFGLPEDKIFEKMLGPKDAAECYKNYKAATLKRLHTVKPFDGILAVLETLRASENDMAIFTGRSRPTTEIILEHTKLGKFFSEVVTNSDLKNFKPHPEGIHMICKKLGHSLDSTMMVGDTPYDIQAGKDAGVKTTVGCLWDLFATKEKLLLSGADHVIENPNEINSVLERRE